MKDSIFFASVIIGAGISVAGLAFQSGLALFVGVFIGGIVPMVAAAELGKE